MADNASRIDYIIEKHTITEQSETPRLAQQWQQVVATCQEQQADSLSRLKAAFATVDYLTSFELPFRLMLIRAPQLIDHLREDRKVYSQPVEINGRKRGVVYSRHADFTGVPKSFQYHRTCKLSRSGAAGGTTASYTAITKQTDVPRERLRLALTSGLLVTALDALLFFGIQRVAADVQRLRAQGMSILMLHVTAFDSQTQTVREIPAYCCA
ncbi:DNA-binding protein [Serratia fonticola]|uniref:DNA-binding protein n=1 Tax=Serratia fonticola TaxID=47917 RepID=UPI00301DC47F